MTSRNISAAFFLFVTVHLFGQLYIPGHQEIQMNSSKAGLSIQNLQSSSTSALDVYSDNNRNFQFGIGNSGNGNVGPDIAYLFTPAGVPIEFYTGGLFRRMHLTADGKLGINAPTSFLELLYIGGDARIEQADLWVNQGTASMINNLNYAIIAYSSDSTAIKGTSSDGNGIEGYASAFGKAGIYGQNDLVAGIGVMGTSLNGTGVFGISENDDGVEGQSTHNSGVYGTSSNSYGVQGESSTTYGVYGKSTSFTSAGVYGESTHRGVIGHGNGTGHGVLGTSGGGHGVVGRSTDNGNGQFDFYADGSSMDYGTSSSRRWKRNIIPIDNALKKLAHITGVYYDWDSEHGGRHDLGFIAEEVGEVLPEIVSYEKNGVDAIAMDYSKITALLAEAIKELQNNYENELKELSDQIDVLKYEIISLKKYLSEIIIE